MTYKEKRKKSVIPDEPVKHSECLNAIFSKGCFYK